MSKNDEFEVTMKLHDMAMSDDAETASLGRLAKSLVPVLDAFTAAEKARGTPPESVAYALMRASGLVGSCVLPYVKRGGEKVILGLFVEGIKTDFEEMIRKLEEQRAEGTGD